MKKFNGQAKNAASRMEISAIKNLLEEDNTLVMELADSKHQDIIEVFLLAAKSDLREDYANPFNFSFDENKQAFIIKPMDAPLTDILRLFNENNLSLSESARNRPHF